MSKFILNTIRNVISVLFVLLYGKVMYTFIYPLLIPDECYYHSNDPTFLIELLFDFPSSNGYHPVPSRVGYILAWIVGFLIGRQVVEYLDKKVNNVIKLE